MILLARKNTSTEAGWIVFAVIFSTFSSALIIFLCWRNTRGSSKKSSSAQQQSASSDSRTISRRSVRYWYYYPEYFSYNGSSESSEDHDVHHGRDFYLEQTPNYYIYPPPYPPCPDPPQPPPQPPRTPPHIAVYRTRPVNVMSFLDRTQMSRKPPPVTEVASPEQTSTPTDEDGSPSASDSGPDEPPPDGNGPPPSGPSGSPSDGPQPDGSAPDLRAPDANSMGVQLPKEDGSVISRQEVSEAQANFSKLMSVAGTISERSAPSQAGSGQPSSVNLGHQSMSRGSKASIRESAVDDESRVRSPPSESRSQHPSSGAKAESNRQNSERRTSSVCYVKAPTNASSKERRSSMAASPRGRSPASSTARSPTPAPGTSTPKPTSHASNLSLRPSICSHTSPRLSLSPSFPGSRVPSHRSPLYTAFRRSSPPQSSTPPHHCPIPSSPNRHSRSYSRSHSHTQVHSNSTSRHSSPPQSPTPPHRPPIPHVPSRYSYGRPTSRHSSRSKTGSGISSMPPSPTVTDLAPIASMIHPPRSAAPPGSLRSSSSPAYNSGGLRAALSPQSEEHNDRKGSRQSSRYLRHCGEKSPSAVSVSVVELLSLEKEQDDKVGQGEPMSLLEQEEYEEREDCEERRDSEVIGGSEAAVQNEDEQRRRRRSVSSDPQRQRLDLAEDEGKSVEMGHAHDHHDDDQDPDPEPEQVPEDYYRSYSPVAPAATTDLLPSSPNLSGHSSDLSPKSPHHPHEYIQIQVPKENRPHQASVCSVSDSTDSGIGGVGEEKGG